MSSQQRVAAPTLPSNPAHGLPPSSAKSKSRPAAGQSRPAASQVTPATSSPPQTIRLTTAASAPSPFEALLQSLSQDAAALQDRKERALSASAVIQQGRRASSGNSVRPADSRPGTTTSTPRTGYLPRMGASPLSPLRRSRTKSLDALDSSQRFSDVMSGLTQEIAGRAAERSAGPSLGKFLARNFVAGRLASSAASSVDVCQDALQYKFHHATHGQVKMAMYYRDMHAATLDGPRLTLTFRVRRTLRYFGSDYDPDDASHLLSLQLCATADVARLGDLLQTRVAGICCS